MESLKYFNTDQGPQHTVKAFTRELKEHCIRISMDGKGRAMGNIMVERFWWLVKYEEVYTKKYSSVTALVQGDKEYFYFYKNECTHQSLGNKTPLEVYSEDVSDPLAT